MSSLNTTTQLQRELCSVVWLFAMGYDSARLSCMLDRDSWDLDSGLCKVRCPNICVGALDTLWGMSSVPLSGVQCRWVSIRALGAMEGWCHLEDCQMLWRAWTAGGGGASCSLDLVPQVEDGLHQSSLKHSRVELILQKPGKKDPETSTLWGVMPQGVQSWLQIPWGSQIMCRWVPWSVQGWREGPLSRGSRPLFTV